MKFKTPLGLIRKLHPTSGLAIILVCFPVGIFAGCSSVFLSHDMRTAEKSFTALFEAAWSPDDTFFSEDNSQHILQQLDRLSGSLRHAEEITAKNSSDLTYQATFDAIETQLADARERFKAGQKDYSQWQIRRIGESCILCHTRYQATVDFVPDTIPETVPTWDNRFRQAQYLFSIRQFDKSSSEFLDLVTDGLESGIPLADIKQAAFYWLTIEIKVKNRLFSLNKKLERIAEHAPISGELQDIITQWSADSDMLLTERWMLLAPLRKARALTQDLSDEISIAEDENNLVKTLYASSILQGELPLLTNRGIQAELSYLAGLTYVHTPIPSLRPYGDLYLEQCILENPGTDYAQRAFLALYQQTRLMSTGSGGVHFDPADSSHLAHLKTLAYGNEPQTK
ncbi:MAG: hypothetical protein PHC51_06790 [bacterium]|nr:hypothetical protein [bacterium]